MDLEKELQAIRRELERIRALGRPSPRLFTRDEAAEALGYSPHTVDRMIQRGLIHLAAGSRPRRPRIPASEIARLQAPRVAPVRAGGRRPAPKDLTAEAAKVRAALRKR